MPSTSPWALGSHFYIQVTHMPSTSPWALGTFIFRAAHNAFYESLGIGVHLIERLPFGLLHVPEPRVPFQVYLTQNIFVNVISVTHEFTVSKSYFISMLSSISPSNIKPHAFHQVYFQNFLEIITIPCFSEKLWKQVLIIHHTFYNS